MRSHAGSATREPIERLESDKAESGRRDGAPLADQPDLARAPGIEHDEPGQEPPALSFRVPRGRRRAGGGRPALIPRAPHLQSQASARVVVLDREVVRDGSRSDAVEQDPALPPDGSASGAAASRRSESASTIAPRNWLRTCSPRSATSSAAPRIASERRRSASGGSAPARRASGTSPATRRARATCRSWPRARAGVRGLASARRSAARATSGSAWIAGVDDGAAVRRGSAKRTRWARREATSTTCGSVLSQSMARCGSSIRAASAHAASTAASTPGAGSVSRALPTAIRRPFHDDDPGRPVLGFVADPPRPSRSAHRRRRASVR